MQEQLKRILETRYATKVFDADQVADSDKVKALIETLRLTPSSLNSQPWHVLAISSPELKKKLSACAWDSNKAKYVDASHLFIFCRKSEYSEDDLSETVALNDLVRGVSTGSERLDMMQGYLASMGERQRVEWMNRQIYLMLGQFLSSCAVLALDACPVEGFLPEEMDTILGLEDKGLKSVVSAVVGVASPNDFNALNVAPKVRFEQSHIVSVIDGDSV